MKQYLVIVIVIIIAVVIYFQLKVETKKLTIINSQNKRIEVQIEVADTLLKKARGLMFRDSLEKNSGMLFVFNNTAYHSFWMLNTKISLEAIHIDETMRIVDIIEMEPCKEKCNSYSPKRKSRYVLEVNKGFSKENNVAIDDRIEFNFKKS